MSSKDTIPNGPGQVDRSPSSSASTPLLTSHNDTDLNQYDGSWDERPASPVPPKLSLPIRIFYAYRGAFLILLAEFLMSVMNVVARYLETSLPPDRKLHPFHVMFWRMSVTCACCLAWGFWNRIPDFPFGKRELWGILLLRAMSGFCGISLFYTALKTLPLPDATVINFCVPTVTGIFCALLPALREPFTRLERMTAVVSFVGVLLIARPTWLSKILPFLSPSLDDDSDDISPGARAFAVTILMFSVIAASSAYTTIRWIGNRAHSLISVFYFSGLVTVLTSILVLAIPSIPNFHMPESSEEWTCLTVLSVVGFAAQWSLTKGLQLEKAGRGIQLMYMQLLFAGVFEWAIWGYVPGIWTWTGGFLIIGSLVCVNILKEKNDTAKTVIKDMQDEETGLLANEREGR
ncbi:hypothetical protein EX30DRAFT_306962 [Ascodesmis nigricans]|uniref:EamA domain-containing protein n=1 Tax=Ascodesmis nigricans TaxID=341454 RepID=A0A4S2MW70_9PEZI|nr:hypothetical protein EX30DRAFT_306962 [Ascodesmis nigricans]